MAATVHFCDLSASFKRPLERRFKEMLEAAGLKEATPKDGLIAIKIHFGEPGNTAYVRPIFARWTAEAVREAGGKPFLTDCNTLYVGARAESVSHLRTAHLNGFGFEAAGAPIVIADGLKGKSEVGVEIGGERIETAYLGRDIVEADAVISLAHFKGHELSGFGGAIKNLGMGCASRRGKLVQHSAVAPKIKEDKCLGCAACIEACPGSAIELVEETAAIDDERCLGCGSCLLICPNQAIDIQWDREPAAVMEAMAEYAAAVAKDKPGRLLCVNVLTQISPACDCYPFSNPPITPDIGFLASRDPVAVDQAAWDMVTEGISFLDGCQDGADKFRRLYPKVDPAVTLAHAEKMDLGTREYELKRVESG